MSGSIGGVTCSYLRLIGQLSPHQRIEMFESIGIDGAGSHDLAQAPGAVIFEAIELGVIADVNIWSGLISDLPGDGIIQATDDRNITYTGLQVTALTLLRPDDYRDAGVQKVAGYHTITCSQR